MATALVFGALMELVQGQVGRDASLGDWFADGVGAAAGIGFWKAWTIVTGITLERGR
jgi:VanZ family protein